MKPPSAVLFFPPGWTLMPGGPHIALPLLKGFLEDNGVSTEIVDLNLGAATQYGVSISEQQAEQACLVGSIDSLNEPYFQAEDRLNTVARTFSGKWDLQAGFEFDSQDTRSSESVRLHSARTSPFTAFFRSGAVRLVLDHKPTLVGISVSVTSQLTSSFELCRLLRLAGYSGRIVLGGNIITRLQKEMCLPWIFDLFDGFVTLEGEESLLALAKGDSLASIPNLTWRNGMEIVVNPAKILPTKKFSKPDFSGLLLDQYWGVKYLPMIASRGCYYGKCSFCSIPFGWGNGGFIGHGTAGEVVQSMIEAYERFGIANFKFIDEALHPPLLRRISEILIGLPYPFAFEGYARFDPAWEDPDFLSLVSRAGLRKVYMGLEIVGGDSRSTLNKGDRMVEKAADVLLQLRNAGILMHCFCMFGFPGTGTEEALNTIEFAFKHSGLIDSLDVFPYYYAKHTTVSGIKATQSAEQDWAVEFDYVGESEGVLSQGEVKSLCDQIESFVWKERPTWIHPVYRMFSPWASLQNSALRESQELHASSLA